MNVSSWSRRARRTTAAVIAAAVVSLGMSLQNADAATSQYQTGDRCAVAKTGPDPVMEAEARWEVRNGKQRLVWVIANFRRGPVGWDWANSVQFSYVAGGRVVAKSVPLDPEASMSWARGFPTSFSSLDLQVVVTASGGGRCTTSVHAR